ncbi:Phosphoinositide 3-kinase [Trypanosoma melophagium]|uniref:Phosphoinositide 3-kinase n=1 Tax=Trypanosoma melophagium TaxID=715481 RepID=UPI00351AA433|nr:Phosphoinositide 3-kinase [Trypanosoma melophagium]
MDDIRFPAWVHRAPVFIMTRVLARHLREQLLASPTADYRHESDAQPTPSLFNPKYVDPLSSFDDDEPSAALVLNGDRMIHHDGIGLNYRNDIELGYSLSQSYSGDVLNHPRVVLLISLSQVNELMTEKVGVSVKNAPALIALMALAVEWRSLPSDYTKGFYTECASFYTSVMQRLGSMVFLPGVDVQGFVASLVSCGLFLGCVEDEEENESGNHGNTGSHNNNSNNGNNNSNGRVKNIGLAGFDRRIIDSIIISCIPSEFDDCVGNPIALGALEGIAYTRKKDPVDLGLQPVDHLHNLTDAFTVSPRRKELPYKRLLCYLMEALCRAKCMDYARMHNWLSATLQRDYLLKGLLQKENLHARLVAATLTLLSRWIQGTVSMYTSDLHHCSNKGEEPSVACREELLEADTLLEVVWNSLHGAIDTWEKLNKMNVSLYSDNVHIVVENLLRVELERVQCYRIISGRERITDVSECNDDAGNVRHIPSAEEEEVILRVIKNIVKFLLLPGSVLGAITSGTTGITLQQSIAEQCVKVVAIIASTESSITLLKRGSRSTSSNNAKTCFSNNFYNAMEGIAHELILSVLETGVVQQQQSSSPSRPSSSTTREEGARRLAALCLQGLCATNSHIRSFAVTEVLDAVMRFPAAKQSIELTRPSGTVTMGVSEETGMVVVTGVARLSVCFEMMNRILVSPHHSILNPLPYEGIVRFVKLLSDTFEDTLRLHVSSGDLANPAVTFPSSTLLVVAESFWKLVKRCHERIRVMTREGLRLQSCGHEGAKKQLLHALNEESKILRLLLRAILSCMINVAWPGSGILYSTSMSHTSHMAIVNPSHFDVVQVALDVLSLFLRPLCLLCQLSTLFPVMDLSRLLQHHENASGLTRMDGYDALLHYYCFQPNNVNSPIYAENGMAQFRSCWLMLSFYRFTNDAVLLTETCEMGTSKQTKIATSSSGVIPSCSFSSSSLVLGETKETKSSEEKVFERYSRKKMLLTGYQAKCFKLLAASMPPLLYMRSSDYQQTMADIKVLKRQLSNDSTLDDCKKYRKEMLRFIRHYSPEIGKYGGTRLSFSEVFLVNALLTLEALRASCGSISTITQYQHYEVREFDASNDVRDSVGYVTRAVTLRYIVALENMLPDVAARRIDDDARQLVLLYGFSIDSVRRSAKEILTKVIETFPAFATNSAALPLLWTVINVLEVGSAVDVERFCAHLRFPETPAVAADPQSFERQKQLQDAVAFAQYWIEVARKHSSLALLEHATLFIIKEETSSEVFSSGVGSQLAIHAQSVDATSAHLGQKYAQSLIKRSKAQGEVTAVMQLTPSGSVDKLFLKRLYTMAKEGLETVHIVERLHEKYFSFLLSTARLVTGQAEYNEYDDDTNNDGTANINNSDDNNSNINQQQQITSQVNGSMVVTPLSVKKMREADTILSTVAAFLMSANISPSSYLELLRYHVQGPIYLFTSSYIGAAIRCWKWLLFEKRERFAVPLLVQVIEGFLWTISQRIGLFDGSRPSQTDEVESGEKTVSMDSATIYPHDYNVNSPHKLLIEFISTCYVDSKGPASFYPSVLLLLHHLALRIVESPSQFSTKDSSFSETIRCTLMISSICRNLQIVNKRRLSVGSSVLVAPTSIGVLRQGWYRCLLHWFRKSPPSWYFTRDPTAAEEELIVLQNLVHELDADHEELSHSVDGFIDFALPTGAYPDSVNLTLVGTRIRRTLRDNVNGVNSESVLVNKEVEIDEQDRILNLISLLRLLVGHERRRLMVWLKPREVLNKTPNDNNGDDNITTINNTKNNDISEVSWKIYCEAAARNDPAVLLSLVARFPNIYVMEYASKLVAENPQRYCHIPEAVDLYLSDEVLMKGYPELYLFTNCSIIQALRFLDKHYTKRYPQVSAYALRSLLSQKSENLIFYLPQILQVLSSDESGGIISFLCKMSEKSEMFTHQLLWSLQTEGEGDSELAKKCLQLANDLRERFNTVSRKFHDDEFSFIDKLIALSGEMKPIEKSQRKEKLRLRLRDVEYHEPIGRSHLYLPTDPHWRIVGLIPHTAGAMQSAAKCPILVQFKCIPRKNDDTTIITQERKEETVNEKEPIVKACIFKMGDDCRQDQIALQLIALFQRIFNAIQVPSYLYPYRVVTTGSESGVIECVPNAMSRDQIGKLVESNLAEYFVQTYGHPESVTFHRARDCFIRSMASYSVASFVLNIKDRHNGNIMIDSQGHLVHIDFGFLFDFSPGGDINFESSPFKLTAEMLQLMGHPVRKGNGTVQSSFLAKALVNREAYDLFVDLTVRCFLAVRQYARQICVLVELMLGSGLPCFKPRRTIQDLAWRLAMRKDEVEAAEFMLKRISESKENIRTILYDRYQNFAEGIEM